MKDPRSEVKRVVFENFQEFVENKNIIDNDWDDDLSYADVVEREEPTDLSYLFTCDATRNLACSKGIGASDNKSDSVKNAVKVVLGNSSYQQGIREVQTMTYTKLPSLEPPFQMLSLYEKVRNYLLNKLGLYRKPIREEDPNVANPGGINKYLASKKRVPNNEVQVIPQWRPSLDQDFYMNPDFKPSVMMPGNSFLLVNALYFLPKRKGPSNITLYVRNNLTILSNITISGTGGNHNLEIIESRKKYTGTAAKGANTFYAPVIIHQFISCNNTALLVSTRRR